MIKPIVSAALTAFLLAGCATGAVSPMIVSDAPKARVYLDDYIGDGYRIKITRDAGKMGSLCMTQIFIDGKLAAEIGQAEAAIFKVSPGVHILKASPARASSTCKTFYSAPQFQVETTVDGAAGDVRIYQYGFSGSGLPALTPSVNM
jgi:hypothetical protein